MARNTSAHRHWNDTARVQDVEVPDVSYCAPSYPIKAPAVSLTHCSSGPLGSLSSSEQAPLSFTASGDWAWGQAPMNRASAASFQDELLSDETGLFEFEMDTDSITSPAPKLA